MKVRDKISLHYFFLLCLNLLAWPGQGYGQLTLESFLSGAPAASSTSTSTSTSTGTGTASTSATAPTTIPQTLSAQSQSQPTLDSTYSRNLKGSGVRWFAHIDRSNVQGPGFPMAINHLPGTHIGGDPIILRSTIGIIPETAGWNTNFTMDPISLDLKVVSERDERYPYFRLNYLYALPTVNMGEDLNLGGGNTFGVNAGLSMWHNWYAPAIGTTFNFKDHMSVYFGFYICPSRDRTVAYLGPYSADPEELDKLPPEQRGLHGVQITDNKGKGGPLDLGVFLPASAVGIRSKLIYFKSKFKTCKVFLPLKTVQNYIKDGKKWGITRFFTKSYMEGIPDLRKPENLKKDEEISYSVEQDATFLLSLGSSALIPAVNAIKVGFMKSLLLRYQVNVKKLADNKIEVNIQDMTVKDFNLFLRALILMGLTKTSSVEMTKNQKFEIDLNNPKGYKFYLELVGGKVPNVLRLIGQLSELVPGKEQEVKSIKKMNDLWESFHLDKKELAEMGVKRMLLETANFPLKRASATMKIYWLPPTWVPGLSYEKIKGEGKVMITDGRHSLRKHIMVQNIRKDVIFKNKSSGVISFKKTYFHPNGRKPWVTGLVVQDFLEETKVGKERKKEIWNNAFEKYNLDPSKNLSQEDLARYEELYIEDKDAINLVFERTFVKADIIKILKTPDAELSLTLLKLKKNLQLPKTFNAKFSVLEEFIEEQQQKGLVELHQFLGGEEKDLNIRYTSSIYSSALDQVKEFYIMGLDPEDPEAFENLSFSLNSSSSCKEKLAFNKKIKSLRKMIDDRRDRAMLDPMLRLNPLAQLGMLNALDQAFLVLSLMNGHYLNVQDETFTEMKNLPAAAAHSF